jgi:hypothetical protein
VYEIVEEQKTWHYSLVLFCFQSLHFWIPLFTPGSVVIILMFARIFMINTHIK